MFFFSESRHTVCSYLPPSLPPFPPPHPSSQWMAFVDELPRITNRVCVVKILSAQAASCLLHFLQTVVFGLLVSLHISCPASLLGYIYTSPQRCPTFHSLFHLHRVDFFCKICFQQIPFASMRPYGRRRFSWSESDGHISPPFPGAEKAHVEK